MTAQPGGSNRVSQGGLGSLVAETLIDAGQGGLPFVRLGFPDVFTAELGSQAEIMAKYGLTPEGVARHAGRLLGRSRQPGSTRSRSACQSRT